MATTPLRQTGHSAGGGAGEGCVLFTAVPSQPALSTDCEASMARGGASPVTSIPLLPSHCLHSHTLILSLLFVVAEFGSHARG
jgi:hypothetical protein